MPAFGDRGPQRTIRLLCGPHVACTAEDRGAFSTAPGALGRRLGPLANSIAPQPTGSLLKTQGQPGGRCTRGPSPTAWSEGVTPVGAARAPRLCLLVERPWPQRSKPRARGSFPAGLGRTGGRTHGRGPQLWMRWAQSRPSCAHGAALGPFATL